MRKPLRLLLPVLVIMGAAALLGPFDRSWVAQDTGEPLARERSDGGRSDSPGLLGVGPKAETLDQGGAAAAPGEPHASEARWVRLVNACGDEALRRFPILVGGVPARTDEVGRVHLPPRKRVRLPEETSTRWQVAGTVSCTGEGESVLYLLPLVPVDVLVTYHDYGAADQGSTRGTLRASFVWNPVCKPTVPRVPSTQLNWQALRFAGLDVTTLARIEPDARGVARTQVHVPELPGFALTIETQGWLQASSPLGLPRDGATYELHVRRAPRIAGKLVDEAGRPLSGVKIEAHFFMVGNKDELPLDRAFKRVDTGGGITCAFDINTGHGGFSFQQEVTTGPDGAFVFVAPLPGMSVQLSAVPRGRRAAVEVRRDVGADMDGVVLRAPAASPEMPRVQFELRGRAIASSRIALTDVTNPHAQSTRIVTTDAEGRAASNGLIEGRAYVARSGSPGSEDGFVGVFVWSRQSRIRGEDLLPYPTWLERQQGKR